MKKALTILAISCCLSSVANAYYGDWITADQTGAEEIDYTYARCYYKTSSYGDFADQRITIIIRGSEYDCPYTIEYNPLTGRWKK